MEKSTNYYSISKSMIILFFVFTANFAFAQNLSGIAPLDIPSTEVYTEDETFANVSMSQVGLAESVSGGSQSTTLDYYPESSNYTLGKEDIIEIAVARHPEVSGQYIINNEGKIQYEFIGDVTIEGMKKDEVKEFLTERLSEYIISPDVVVKIIGYNSKIVYVIGEVSAPGKIFMRGDTITVREALVQAGLPLLSGKLANSRLITPSDSGKVERKTVNVHKLLYEGDLRENLVMQPGDTLYVPPTVMARAMRVIKPVADPINSAGSTGRRVFTGGF